MDFGNLIGIVSKISYQWWLASSNCDMADLGKNGDLRFLLDGKPLKQTKDETFSKGKVGIYCAFAIITIDDFLVDTFLSFNDIRNNLKTTLTMTVCALYKFILARKLIMNTSF